MSPGNEGKKKENPSGFPVHAELTATESTEQQFYRFR